MTSIEQARRRIKVLGVPIDVISFDDALQCLQGWVGSGQSRVVCAAAVHQVVTSLSDPLLAQAHHEAELIVPDGVPVVWMQRKLGAPEQSRIFGPDLMWRYCVLADKTGEGIYLYGASPVTLDLLQQKLMAAFPNLQIVGAYSPPFRELTEEEDAEVVDAINASGAGTVWVGLGCPKQEKWMQAHRGKIHVTMIGVGAAFDYHAGVLKRAPVWMQFSGLEWLYRLIQEPRRLWRRYLVTNSIFTILALRQLLSGIFR